MKLVSLFLSIFLLVACQSSTNTKPDSTSEGKTISQKVYPQEQAMAAFAKLYGYARYFHPTDHAMIVDWDKFLIYGIDKIKANNSLSLDQLLNQIFEPLSDNLMVYNNSFKPIIESPTPLSGQQLKMWQHLGLGDDSPAHYASNRLGDIPDNYTNPIFAYLAGEQYKGKYYKLIAKVKVEGINEQMGGRLFLSAYDARGTEVTNDFKKLPLIDDKGWRTQRVTGKLNESTAYIMLGGELIGPGQMWLDDFEMQISIDGETWDAVTIPNHQFDQSDESLPASDWRASTESFYTYQLSKEGDNNVMSITSKGNPIPGQLSPLDDYRYTAIQKAINDEFSVHLPITVWSGPEKSTSASFIKLQEILAAIDTPNLTADDENVRLANVIKLWNVIQHYYPYFDVVDVQWEDLLIPSLKQASYDQSPNQHYLALSQLLAHTKDGHGVIYFNSEHVLTGIPLKVSLIEGELVVVGSEIDAIRKGDLITHVNGLDAKDYLTEQMSYVSGSPHLTELRTLNQFGYGESGTDISLVLKRGQLEMAHTHTRESTDTGKTNMFFNRVDSLDLPDLEELEPGIFYVNLQTTSKKDFDDHKTKLTHAKGIIFDKRWDGKMPQEQPTVSEIRDLIPHLTKTTVSSPTWLTPVYTKPDQVDTFLKESGWDIAPAEPYFSGNRVFINVPSVVSAGETFTSFIDHYELGELVGENTAGCNGNANFTNLIGGYRVMFTGMKVIKHDKSQLHLIGFEPDYPVKRTIKGIMNNQDELLEKALAVIKAKD